MPKINRWKRNKVSNVHFGDFSDKAFMWEESMKRILTGIFCAALSIFPASLFAGDAAVFSDIGFSQDGLTYVFGEYGKTDQKYQAWAEIYGAVFFNYSHHALNRLENENNVPVWQYLFTKSNGRLGCWHSGEMVYAFHNIPDKSKLYDEDDRKLSDLMNEYWISFAKTGNPNSGSESGFETSDSERIMEFGNVNGMIDEPYLKLYEIIDRMQGVK